MPGGGGLHARHAGPPRRVGGGNKAGIEASAKISRFPARERACLPAAQIAAASAGHLSPRFAQSLRAPQLQSPQGLENSAPRLSLARTLDTAAVRLCDLRLGLSLSGLLCNNRAPDADIPRPAPPPTPRPSPLKHQLLAPLMGLGCGLSPSLRASLLV